MEKVEPLFYNCMNYRPFEDIKELYCESIDNAYAELLQESQKFITENDISALYECYYHLGCESQIDGVDIYTLSMKMYYWEDDIL